MKQFLISCENTALISRNHILNVNERIFSSMYLKQFKRLLNQISQIGRLPLTIINFIAHILVLHTEKVKDRNDLPVIGHKSLTDRI